MTLYGGSGRGILIGGTGRDRLIGGSGEDILIGGTTRYDQNDVAMDAILAEWSSNRSYATRVANLRGTGSGPRLNGFFFLTSGGTDPTVLNDGEFDKLTGSNGLDWFFIGPGDQITDRKNGEQVG